MTHDEKIHFMSIAAGICNFSIPQKECDLLVSLFEEVIAKQGEFTLRDAARIKVEVADRENERRIKLESAVINKPKKEKPPILIGDDDLPF